MSIPRTKCFPIKAFPSIAAVLVLSAFGLNTPSSSAQPPTMAPGASYTSNQQSLFNYFTFVGSNPANSSNYSSFFAEFSSLPAIDQSAVLQGLTPEYFAQQLRYQRTEANTNQESMRGMIRGISRPGATTAGLGGAAGRGLADASAPDGEQSLADVLNGGYTTSNVRAVSYVDGALPVNGSGGYTDPAHCAQPMNENQPSTSFSVNGIGIGNYSKQLFDGNALGIKSTAGTGLAALAFNVSDSLVVGVTGGYNRIHLSTGAAVDLVAFGFAADVSSYIGVGYFTFTPVAPVSITGSAGFSHDQIDNRVALTIQQFGGVPPVSLLARGSESGNDFLSSLGIDVYLPLGGFYVHPSAYLQYSYMSQNAFTENANGVLAGAANGAAVLGLTVDGSNSYSLQSVLAVELGYLITMGDTKIAPSLNVSYAHEFAPVADASLGAFTLAAGGGAAPAASTAMGRDYFGCGGGVGIMLNRNISLFGAYGYQYATHSISQTGTGGIALSW
jgi:outer membrane autotransporter protein